MGLGLHVFGQITFSLETANKTIQKCQFLGSFPYIWTFFYLHLEVLALHVWQLAHLFVILSSARKKTVHHITSYT